MRCPHCGFEQPDGGTECIKCGIIFDKFAKRQRGYGDRPGGVSRIVLASDEPEGTEEKGRCEELFFFVDPQAGNFALTGRIVILAVLFIWGLKLVFHSVASNYAGESFLHLVNLPFHEAGHILFRAFGQFMMTLGGSLTQLLVPLICLLTFLLKTRDTFGASVSLWWLGENLLDLAPYINDARDLNLVLLGGVTGKDVEDFHDWEYILRKTGLLPYDHLLAKASDAIGALLMACAVIWGGFLLYKQFRNQRERAK
ncbi:MAG: hypothetical protein M0Z60_01890 [Nitrospiraceae bacterium]|nr:hypothetical protein [Nitrospiraceae bacterium]